MFYKIVKLQYDTMQFFGFKYNVPSDTEKFYVRWKL